ncbi:MAG: hypothetical protein DSZ31_00915 [Gammaproteobacteria bacterium]|nr:MAG: hypothetical protein DSZ31_00915 [Gammaproteobacteria bacterium]
MRLIDKLPFLEPPREKYNLLPPLNKLKLPLLSKREKVVFPFVVDTVFYRGLSFNSNYQTLKKPFERTYPEETTIEEVLEHLKEELKELMVQKPKLFANAVFGTYIPARFGLVRIYTFPKTIKRNELIQSVDLYIQEDISENFPHTEVLYSYDILDSNENEPYRVLVTVVESEIIRKIEEVFEELGLELEVISYEPVCLINLGLLKGLPEPFTILYTERNKILIVSYRRDNILYETFSYLFSEDKVAEDLLNLIIWDIRNYIVLNDISNIYLAGIVTEYEHLTEFFLEKLPIFGIVSIDKFPDRYALTYTLGERLLNV